MNERIKELAEQAKEYADTKYSKLVSASRWGDCVPGIRELYTEKFAELIVREMCSVLDKEQWDKGEDWICADGTRIIPQIKEHFGVEE